MSSKILFTLVAQSCKEILLDCEISAHIQKTVKSLGDLTDRVWSQHSISPNTKIMVCMAFVIRSLLYCCETWTTYAHHIRTLERFHQKCLRISHFALKIKWQALVLDTVVLGLAAVPSIESLILLDLLRWSGHLVRLDDSRIQKKTVLWRDCFGEKTHWET